MINGTLSNITDCADDPEVARVAQLNSSLTSVFIMVSLITQTISLVGMLYVVEEVAAKHKDELEALESDKEVEALEVLEKRNAAIYDKANAWYRLPFVSRVLLGLSAALMQVSFLFYAILDNLVFGEECFLEVGF